MNGIPIIAMRPSQMATELKRPPNCYQPSTVSGKADALARLLTADCSYHPPVQSQSPPSELLFEHRLLSQAPRVFLTLHPPAWRPLHSVRRKLLDCSKRRKHEHQASSPLLESVRRQPANQTRRQRSPGHRIRATCRQLGFGRRRSRRFLQRELQRSSPGGPLTTLHGPISSNCATYRKGGQ
jgi:hypothetical protein